MDESDNNTNTRSSKPGRKRLAIVLSLLFSFLTGLPFWLKSIEVYRTHLPYEAVNSLARTLKSNPITLPCEFDVILLKNYQQDLSILKENILQEVKSRIAIEGHGGCGNNPQITLTLDTKQHRCENNSVPCGLSNQIFHSSKNLENDDVLDEFLEEFFHGSRNDGGKYSIVVTGENGDHRAVIGKHRHAWIRGEVSESDIVAFVGEVFVRYFMNGGSVSSGVTTEEKGEAMPLAADGSAILSFSLLNAEPRDWIYNWNFQNLESQFFSPLLEALAPVATLSVESQVLYHTPKAAHSHWDEESENYVFHVKDLPFFVNSNEWHLDTSVAAAGRSKILHFAIYIPSASECPLQLQLPNGELSRTNGFTSPGWGGIVVFNPPFCSQNEDYDVDKRHEISENDFKGMMEVVVGQIRTLLGLPSTVPQNSQITLSSVMSQETGFSKWELDVLLRQRVAANVASSSTTLESLLRLVKSLPGMVIKDEIGNEVRQSLEAASMARKSSSMAAYKAAAEYSKKARAWAEAAFFQPSIMSLLYFPIEHHFAIYTPFFVPVLLHTLLGAMKEVARYRREQKKFAKTKLS